MERLTIPDVRVDEHTTRRSVIDVAAVREHAMEFYCRLKAYEDTGLTPEEIKAPFTEDAMINLAAQALGVEADRLRELAEADKDGRVVVLPCKVGDTVWIVGAVRKLYSAKVRTFFCGHTSAVRGGDDDGHIHMIRTTECDIPMQKFGKAVFLSREEAEKALQEMEDKKDGV